MGFRSTATSEEVNNTAPKWFKEKYGFWLCFEEDTLTLAFKREYKMYKDEGFFVDYQKALIEVGAFHEYRKNIVCIILDEDQQVTKVVISEDSIEYYLMDEGYQIKEPPYYGDYTRV